MRLIQFRLTCVKTTMIGFSSTNGMSHGPIKKGNALSCRLPSTLSIEISALMLFLHAISHDH
jgi:hypothetical protein